MEKAKQIAREILAAMPKWQRDYVDWYIKEKEIDKMKTIKEINTDTEEGRMLIMSIAKLTTESQTDKTPDEMCEQVHGLCSSVYATKKESDKVEKLPTKKELTERLQKACDVLNEYAYGRLYVNVGYANDLVVILEDRDNTSRNIGHAVYRPDPKPPGNIEWVIVKNNTGVWWPHISRGRMVKGCLETEDSSGIKYWKDWYYPSTGDHSEGWRDEWTPEEFRK